MLIYICASALFISVLHSFYSFKKNKLSLLLSAYYFSLATCGVTHYFATRPTSDLLPDIFFIHVTPIWGIAGPCLYVYSKSTLRDEQRLPKSGWIHFLPFLIYLIFISPYLFSPQINFGLSASLLLIYTLISIKMIFAFYKKEENRHSNSINQKTWLFTLTFSSLALSISMLLVTIDFLFMQKSAAQIPDGPLYTLTLTLFLTIAVSPFFFPQILYGLSNYQPDHPSEPDIEVAKQQVANVPDYNESAMNDPFIELSRRIEEYLKNEKPYLSKDFSMHDIAVAVDAPNHQISNCLNKVMLTNFASLKNQLRVEHSINLLKQNEAAALSIEGISQNAGFATRSSFYTAFKKVTGKTPTDYIAVELVKK